MGIRDVKHIAAVNCDKTARIFKNCEFGIIADLHEVVPKLIELIRSDK
jgi:electron transfer flavoprotein alpha subunit